MSSPAAIGVRDHSGWAALVVVGGELGTPRVVDRRRISLLAPGMPFEPYHTVVGMPVEAARARLRESFESARECARRELSTVAAELRSSGYEATAVGCGVSASPVRVPLERVLKAHPLLHASTGDLYRDAVAEAVEGMGLAVSRVPWKELWTQVGAELGGIDVREAVAQLGASLGPPWASDQKEACAAALLALTLMYETR